MNIIKNFLLNVFGDGFFGLERDDTTQIDISKDNKKPEPMAICYAIPRQEHSCSVMGSCASFSTGENNTAIGHNALSSCNDQFIESHYE